LSEQTEKLHYIKEELFTLEPFDISQQEKLDDIQNSLDCIIYDLEKKEFFPLVQVFLNRQAWQFQNECNNEKDPLYHLARMTTEEFGHNEWLEEGNHWIWDLATEALAHHG